MSVDHDDFDGVKLLSSPLDLPADKVHIDLYETASSTLWQSQTTFLRHSTWEYNGLFQLGIQPQLPHYF